MRKLIVFLFILLGSIFPTMAQSRICNPFTTTPDPGMLGLGTNVQFQRDGQTETGVITAYYIASCFPGAPVMGLDAQAYVVRYSSTDGSQAVLNASALQMVRNEPIHIAVAQVAQETPIPDGFHWFIDCQELDEAGQHHVWVGYTSSIDLPNGGQLEYLGNGPGIYVTDFVAGEHFHAIDVLTDYGDVWLREDTSMEEITITSDTDAPDCGTF